MRGFLLTHVFRATPEWGCNARTIYFLLSVKYTELCILKPKLLYSSGHNNLKRVLAWTERWEINGQEERSMYSELLVH